MTFSAILPGICDGWKPARQWWSLGPIAQLLKSNRSRTRLRPIPFGLAAGEFTVPDDFDAPLPDDMLRNFEGK